MGHFGFSYTGLLFLLMLTVPNLLWTRRQPEGYRELATTEPRMLLVFERIGQVCTTTCALLFRDFNPTFQRRGPWLWWLVAAAVLMLLYEIAWVRYFARGCTLQAFYGHMLGIPCPLATLPVAAFVLLGVYGRVTALIASAVVLGIGHIGIHLRHARTVRDGAFLSG